MSYKNQLDTIEWRSVYRVTSRTKPKPPPSNITFDPMKSINDNKHIRTARTRK